MEPRKGEKRSMQELGRKSVSEFKESEKLPVIIVLDNVRSLHNVGSVFRTADAFAVEKLVLCGITAQPPHREIQKTALGATESVDWEYTEDCKQLMLNLRSEGYKVIGIEQVSGSISLENQAYLLKDVKLALVFGNEVEGVDQDVLDLCDEFWEIPQSGTKHSLNISVSVGIVLWELVRRH